MTESAYQHQAWATSSLQGLGFLLCHTPLELNPNFLVSLLCHADPKTSAVGLLIDLLITDWLIDWFLQDEATYWVQIRLPKYHNSVLSLTLNSSLIALLAEEELSWQVCSVRFSQTLLQLNNLDSSPTTCSIHFSLCFGLFFIHFNSMLDTLVCKLIAHSNVYHIVVWLLLLTVSLIRTHGWNFDDISLVKHLAVQLQK